MKTIKKALRILAIRFSTVTEFFSTLWTYKLWWSFPIIFILLFLMIFLLIAGHTGIAAVIYPLF